MKIKTILACLSFLLLAHVSLDSCLAVGVHSAVYYSDGTVENGTLSLSSGNLFKLNIPDAGDIFTSDMITGEPVRYGKVRKVAIESISKIEFFLQKEEMLQKWKFTSQTKYDPNTGDADYTPADKDHYGEFYPVRYLAAIITVNSGEKIAGHLYSTAVYLETPDRVKKIALLSKLRGSQGQMLDDLVYVNCIKVLEPGKKFEETAIVKLNHFSLLAGDECFAITRNTLTAVPAECDIANNKIAVNSTFGEPVFLAVVRDGKYLAGMPGQGDKRLFELADEHISRVRDFYNDRKLLAVYLTNDGKELLTLVNLRRRFAETNFGDIGGEWDKASGKIVEPWRLSIWRWRYDENNNELVLTGRGSFDRQILSPTDDSPQIILEENLWITQDK